MAVNQHADNYKGYDLSQYKNPDSSYVKLVGDLMDKEHPLSAHLYGLYLKEAEEWFTSEKVK